VVTTKKLVIIRHKVRQDGRIVVFTNGCFDLIHRGHVEYLTKARAMGDLLVVGLNTDRSVRALKGPQRPLNREDDRARVLAALEMVDYVCLFDEDTPAELIAAVVPDVLVKGGDYGLDDIVGRDTVEAAGGKVVAVPLSEGFSTRGMIEKILRRYGKEAVGSGE
jgi:D-beta-D-heptose 7-phosphate kinase/D-beta-D-heptose 1-phosphate adenosyltransferase